MERVPVLSSNIAGLAYDETSKILEIEFKSGGVHQYSGVEPDTFKSLQEAPSLGAFLHANIKGNYQAQKVI